MSLTVCAYETTANFSPPGVFLGKARAGHTRYLGGTYHRVERCVVIRIPVPVY